jgi:hypothetical protein
MNQLSQSVLPALHLPVNWEINFPLVGATAVSDMVKN